MKKSLRKTAVSRLSSAPLSGLPRLVALASVALVLVASAVACDESKPASDGADVASAALDAAQSTSDTTATDATTADGGDPTADATSEDAGKPGFPHGKACADDSECAGGVCLTDLPGGYCATLCDATQPCGDGSACVPTYPAGVSEARWVCVKTCTATDDCRTAEGYTCARDDTCWPAEPQLGLNQRPIGQPCWTDSQCTTKACQRPVSRNKATGYVGGACIKLDCDTSACPANSTCLKLTSGKSACFATCKTASDCRPGYGCIKGGCAPSCAADVDCPAKHLCAGGTCVSSFFGCSITHPAGWCATGHCSAGVCTSGALVCGKADGFEPNDTLASAKKLSSERTFGGQLCPGDSDWFELEAPAGVLTEVTLKFSHPAGDLDLLVHDAKGAFVRSRWYKYPYKGKLWADFDKSDETVAFYHATKPTKVLLKVVGATDKTSNTYGIVVRHLPYQDGTTCSPAHKADDCMGLPGGVLRLVHFPQPIVGAKGAAGAYRFASVSGYKWARRELVMLIRSALGRTRETFPDTGPVDFADLCQYDGVTPGYDIGKPRHCHTCHDQGGNIDIAYFQKDGDHALRPVCGAANTHLNTIKKECLNGALNAHLVDLDQQVVFMAALFDSPRVRAIGVDPVIGKLLKARATELFEAGIVTAAGNKGIQQKLGLWATHHDHIHVSLQWW